MRPRPTSFSRIRAIDSLFPPAFAFHRVYPLLSARPCPAGCFYGHHAYSMRPVASCRQMQHPPQGTGNAGLADAVSSSLWRKSESTSRLVGQMAERRRLWKAMGMNIQPVAEREETGGVHIYCLIEGPSDLQQHLSASTQLMPEGTEPSGHSGFCFPLAERKYDALDELSSFLPQIVNRNTSSRPCMTLLLAAHSIPYRSFPFPLSLHYCHSRLCLAALIVSLLWHRQWLLHPLYCY